MAKLKLSDDSVKAIARAANSAIDDASKGGKAPAAYAAALSATARALLSLIEDELDLRDVRLAEQASRITALEQQLRSKAENVNELGT